MNEGLFFLAYTHSPLHAGIGQAMGKVDLPIAREKHTTYPCVYATGLKGALRKYCEGNTSISEKDIEEIFGEPNASAGAGGAMFTDLKLLLFPVRSSKDSFKWVTCEHVLKRFKRDYQTAGGTDKRLLNLSIETKMIEDGLYDAKKHILLEDFVFEYEKDDPKTFPGMDI
ncbi:MAG: type III-B CRISPR module RAMP protein Cmr4, partial [bacterium]